MALYGTKHDMVADGLAEKDDSTISKTAEVEAQATDELDPKMDARLRRKLDLFIIPVFGVGYEKQGTELIGRSCTSSVSSTGVICELHLV